MKRHWHVLGAGAIGSVFADYLSSGGCPVTLIVTRSHQDTTTPFSIDDGSGARTIKAQVSTVGGIDNITHLLVTTKAHQVKQALLDVLPSLSTGCQVVFLVNGMGYLERCAALLKDCDLYPGTTTEGAYRTQPRCVVRAGQGTTRLGHLSGSVAPDWLDDWTATVPDCNWDSDIREALWQKLAINCAINPLTAVHQCRNGALAEDPQLSAQVTELCNEIAAVSRAAGYTKTANSIHQVVDSVIAGTADNRSSMLQDTLAQRPTELMYITGHLLSVAVQHAIETPLNAALYRQLQTAGL